MRRCGIAMRRRFGIDVQSAVPSTARACGACQRGDRRDRAASIRSSASKASASRWCAAWAKFIDARHGRGRRVPHQGAPLRAGDRLQRLRAADSRASTKCPYLTNETVFDHVAEIRDLIVLGGGPIGVELAQAFARLGVQVQLVEMAQPVAARRCRGGRAGARVPAARRRRAARRHARPTEVQRAGDRIRLACATPRARRRWLDGGHLLVAVGRKPRVDKMGLDAGRESRRRPRASRSMTASRPATGGSMRSAIAPAARPSPMSPAHRPAS